MKIRVSVKDIVELVYGSGDLISEGSLLNELKKGLKFTNYTKPIIKQMMRQKAISTMKKLLKIIP